MVGNFGDYITAAGLIPADGRFYFIIRTESVNEGWNNSIPLTSTRLQPDYSVGFKRDSLFIATYYMYFPFLTCEVECGAAALDIVDRQNVYSMTLAVWGIVELFYTVKCEDEVNRKILAFSVFYYLVITRKDIKYYYYPIRKFNFTELDSKDKWTVYQFTKNLPSELNFDVLPLSEATGLSQDLGNLITLFSEPKRRK
ncbi:uncharacterized protein B0H64DRAFT_421247 [Chaetomium fimeti]|uniref:DUF7924 domain-containing protein n=1 Tax=Chaetomium fimeti TaxID=1854472 RepID=A0AAE0H589_9PEZI|nr:hypothetical protein B0H64DRAFT_421247 [Chaetomium fimeti]